jgi:carbon monoxide dehydrogenase subunit G
MTIKTKAAVKKESKIELNNKIHNELITALGGYKKQLGEKKLEKKIKKLTKLFVKGLKKVIINESVKPETVKKIIPKKKLVNS